MNLVTLSIIIVNHNTKKLLEDCLNSIYINPCAFEFEVIVVDNASCDGSVAMVREKFPLVRIIKNETNIGFAKANNHAVLKSKGAFILYLNSDTLVLKNSLNMMVDFIRHTDEDIACIGCKILNHDYSIQPSTHGFPTLAKEFLHANPLIKSLIHPVLKVRRLRDCIASLIGRGNIQSFENFNVKREVDHVTGACMVVKRSALDKIGLMDENYFLYHEEVDWCYRARKMGYKIIYYPEAKIIHLKGETSGLKKGKQLPTEMLIERYRSMFYFYKTHYSRLSKLFLYFIVMEGFTLRITYNLLKLNYKAVKVYYNIMKLIYMP
ncbi:MAG: glycosyltransferase family 2 protein [Thermodesulfobacteriota bacterium]|nr:glycosyltransferase family 2 protein [Thermodesulfobacteriota bacterium]